MACALTGGDDYELCFTAPESMRHQLLRIAADVNITLTRIGRMQHGEPRVTVLDARGEEIKMASAGFDHFGNNE